MNKRNFFKTSLFTLASTAVPAFAISTKPESELLFWVSNVGVSINTLSGDIPSRRKNLLGLVKIALKWEQRINFYTTPEQGFHRDKSPVSFLKVKEMLGFSEIESFLLFDYNDDCYFLKEVNGSIICRCISFNMWEKYHNRRNTVRSKRASLE